MTEILDLIADAHLPPSLLYHQCRHLRHLLLLRLGATFQLLSTDVLPVLADSARLLDRSAERSWATEHLEPMLGEVAALKALGLGIERLVRCYQEMLTPPPSTNPLPDSEDAAIVGQDDLSPLR